MKRKATAPQATAIYANLNGRCVCAKHIGMEAQAVLSRRPNAKRFSTSMTTWTLLNDRDAREFGCEDCKSGRY